MNAANISLSISEGPQAVKRAPHKPDVREVAAKFEALLLTQMFNAMQNTVEKSGLLDGGSAEEMYREMLNQALSDEVARRGGLGLAELIARRLEPRTNSRDEPLPGVQHAPRSTTDE